MQTDDVFEKHMITAITDRSQEVFQRGVLIAGQQFLDLVVKQPSRITEIVPPLSRQSSMWIRDPMDPAIGMARKEPNSQ